MTASEPSRPLPTLHFQRAGTGKPLLLVHGLGGSSRSWSTVWPALTTHRDVIAVDLPGFGKSPPMPRTTIATLAHALSRFLEQHDLLGVDAVGSSMGARLVLEMARRGGLLGTVVSLDPGGFWQGWERHAFNASIWTSIRAVRALQPAMPFLSRYRPTRALLLAQLAKRPGAIPPGSVLDEMRDYARATAFDELLHELSYGESQKGAPQGSLSSPLIIGWGRNDRVCLPRQAERALALFPDARLHWFDDCGHFPHWDQPAATVELILAATARSETRKASPSLRASRPGLGREPFKARATG